ncbi:hypothetical protein PaG_04504 [Moesziomyces aphidis]|uniref:Arrestin C-terminal-like domain-containing protein n=1 Tax=Moesziomyces aphidis TaxID=84754 RepID=W3VKY4_MOEAP|nr:hypothetical protein PaG_04504 [Moesziomyces aphidis]
MSAFVCKPDPLQSIFVSPPTMELSVRLPSDVFVLPSPLYGAVDTSDAFDTPPAYAASSSSTASASSSSHPSLTAYIQLKVPATASTSYSLASLSAKLVASESLMYNNGGFEQSFPIELTSNPLRHPCTLQPGRTYEFIAQIACPRNLPPSVQLQDARLRYKLHATAKITPTTRGWFSLAKTLTAEREVRVVQAAPEEAFDFSHVKYVSIDGLGSTCISVPPSPCKIGESTQLGLTLPSKDARDCIEHVQMQLVQQTQICKSSRSSIYTQTIPTLALKLHTQPSPGPVDFASQKGYSAEDSVLEAHFSIPTDVQPSTLAGSTAVINVSHRMQMTINFKHTPHSFACSWPVTLAHPHAVRSSAIDPLPPYSKHTLPAPLPPPSLQTL